jgi:hypothetical protein
VATKTKVKVFKIGNVVENRSEESEADESSAHHTHTVKPK